MMVSMRLRPSLLALLLIPGATLAQGPLLFLGDDKYVTDAPKTGYIYLCKAHKETNAGAFQAGDWIQGNTWDPSTKPTVDGNVAWPTAKFTSKTSGTKRVLTSNGLPQHNTGIYPIQATDDAYQYDRNPNSIKTQTLTINVPKNPKVATKPNCMRGEVGMALTGVPIFNGFDAELRDAVAHEIQDAKNGHPEVTGQYHYHNVSDTVVNQLRNKTISNKPVLVGYAFDGFGIYSEKKTDGSNYTNADLDVCHGRTSSVPWQGKNVKMYHYVTTTEFPYTVGCFMGTPLQLQSGTPGQGRNPAGQGRGPNGATGNMGGIGQMMSGSMQGPPQAAITACSGKSAGNSCMFSDEHGSHSGSCTSTPDGKTACRPSDMPPR
jgi:YHYH protein